MGIDSVGPINTNQVSGVKPQGTSETKSENTGIFGKLFSAITSIVKAIFSPILGVLALCKLGGEPNPPVTSGTETKNPREIPPRTTGENMASHTPYHAPKPSTLATPASTKATHHLSTKGILDERFFCFGDSQAGALHGNNEGSQSTFHYNNNGRSQVGANPKAIFEEMSRFLSDTNNVASLQDKRIILSPGADNGEYGDPTDYKKYYEGMRDLLKTKGIQYTVLPPGNRTQQNRHSSILKEVFNTKDETRVLDTSGVDVSKDEIHYNPRQLQQVIDKKYPTA